MPKDKNLSNENNQNEQKEEKLEETASTEQFSDFEQMVLLAKLTVSENTELKIEAEKTLEILKRMENENTLKNLQIAQRIANLSMAHQGKEELIEDYRNKIRLEINAIFLEAAHQQIPLESVFNSLMQSLPDDLAVNDEESKQIFIQCCRYEIEFPLFYKKIKQAKEDFKPDSLKNNDKEIFYLYEEVRNWKKYFDEFKELPNLEQEKLKEIEAFLNELKNQMASSLSPLGKQIFAFPNKASNFYQLKDEDLISLYTESVELNLEIGKQKNSLPENLSNLYSSVLYQFSPSMIEEIERRYLAHIERLETKIKEKKPVKKEEIEQLKNQIAEISLDESITKGLENLEKKITHSDDIEKIKGINEEELFELRKKEILEQKPRKFEIPKKTLLDWEREIDYTQELKKVEEWLGKINQKIKRFGSEFIQEVDGSNLEFYQEQAEKAKNFIQEYKKILEIKNSSPGNATQQILNYNQKKYAEQKLKEINHEISKIELEQQSNSNSKTEEDREDFLKNLDLEVRLKNFKKEKEEILKFIEEKKKIYENYEKKEQILSLEKKPSPKKENRITDPELDKFIALVENLVNKKYEDVKLLEISGFSLDLVKALEAGNFKTAIEKLEKIVLSDSSHFTPTYRKERNEIIVVQKNQLITFIREQKRAVLESQINSLMNFIEESVKESVPSSEEIKMPDITVNNELCDELLRILDSKIEEKYSIPTGTKETNNNQESIKKFLAEKIEVIKESLKKEEKEPETQIIQTFSLSSSFTLPNNLGRSRRDSINETGLSLEEEMKQAEEKQKKVEEIKSKFINKYFQKIEKKEQGPQGLIGKILSFTENLEKDFLKDKELAIKELSGLKSEAAKEAIKLITPLNLDNLKKLSETRKKYEAYKDKVELFLKTGKPSNILSPVRELYARELISEGQMFVLNNQMFSSEHAPLYTQMRQEIENLKGKLEDKIKEIEEILKKKVQAAEKFVQESEEAKNNFTLGERPIVEARQEQLKAINEDQKEFLYDFSKDQNDKLIECVKQIESHTKEEAETRKKLMTQYVEASAQSVKKELDLEHVFNQPNQNPFEVKLTQKQISRKDFLTNLNQQESDTKQTIESHISKVITESKMCRETIEKVKKFLFDAKSFSEEVSKAPLNEQEINKLSQDLRVTPPVLSISIDSSPSVKKIWDEANETINQAQEQLKTLSDQLQQQQKQMLEQQRIDAYCQASENSMKNVELKPEIIAMKADLIIDDAKDVVINGQTRQAFMESIQDDSAINLIKSHIEKVNNESAKLYGLEKQWRKIRDNHQTLIMEDLAKLSQSGLAVFILKCEEQIKAIDDVKDYYNQSEKENFSQEAQQKKEDAEKFIQQLANQTRADYWQKALDAISLTSYKPLNELQFMQQKAEGLLIEAESETLLNKEEIKEKISIKLTAIKERIEEETKEKSIQEKISQWREALNDIALTGSETVEQLQLFRKTAEHLLEEITLENQEFRMKKQIKAQVESYLNRLAIEEKFEDDWQKVLAAMDSLLVQYDPAAIERCQTQEELLQFSQEINRTHLKIQDNGAKFQELQKLALSQTKFKFKHAEFTKKIQALKDNFAKTTQILFNDKKKIQLKSEEITRIEKDIQVLIDGMTAIEKRFSDPDLDLSQIKQDILSLEQKHRYLFGKIENYPIQQEKLNSIFDDIQEAKQEIERREKFARLLEEAEDYEEFLKPENDHFVRVIKKTENLNSLLVNDYRVKEEAPESRKSIEDFLQELSQAIFTLQKNASIYSEKIREKYQSIEEKVSDRIGFRKESKEKEKKWRAHLDSFFVEYKPLPKYFPNAPKNIFKQLIQAQEKELNNKELVLKKNIEEVQRLKQEAINTRHKVIMPEDIEEQFQPLFTHFKEIGELLKANRRLIEERKADFDLADELQKEIKELYNSLLEEDANLNLTKIAETIEALKLREKSLIYTCQSFNFHQQDLIDIKNGIEKCEQEFKLLEQYQPLSKALDLYEQSLYEENQKFEKLVIEADLNNDMSKLKPMLEPTPFTGILKINGTGGNTYEVKLEEKKRKIEDKLPQHKQFRETVLEREIEFRALGENVFKTLETGELLLNHISGAKFEDLILLNISGNLKQIDNQIIEIERFLKKYKDFSASKHIEVLEKKIKELEQQKSQLPDALKNKKIGFIKQYSDASLAYLRNIELDKVRISNLADDQLFFFTEQTEKDVLQKQAEECKPCTEINKSRKEFLTYLANEKDLTEDEKKKYQEELNDDIKVVMGETPKLHQIEIKWRKCKKDQQLFDGDVTRFLTEVTNFSLALPKLQEKELKDFFEKIQKSYNNAIMMGTTFSSLTESLATPFYFFEDQQEALLKKNEESHKRLKEGLDKIKIVSSQFKVLQDIVNFEKTIEENAQKFQKIASFIQNDKNDVFANFSALKGDLNYLKTHPVIDAILKYPIAADSPLFLRFNALKTNVQRGLELIVNIEALLNKKMKEKFVQHKKEHEEQVSLIEQMFNKLSVDLANVGPDYLKSQWQSLTERETAIDSFIKAIEPDKNGVHAKLLSPARKLLENIVEKKNLIGSLVEAKKLVEFAQKAIQESNSISYQNANAAQLQIKANEQLNKAKQDIFGFVKYLKDQKTDSHPKIQAALQAQIDALNQALNQPKQQLQFYQTPKSYKILKLFEDEPVTKTKVKNTDTYRLDTDRFTGDVIFGIEFKLDADRVSDKDLVAMQSKEGLLQTTETGFSFRFFTDEKAETVRAELRKEDVFKVAGDSKEIHGQRVMKTMVGMVASIVAVQNDLHFYGDDQLMVMAGVLYALRLKNELGLQHLDISVKGHGSIGEFIKAHPTIKNEAETFVNSLRINEAKDALFYQQAQSRGPTNGHH